MRKPYLAILTCSKTKIIKRNDLPKTSYLGYGCKYISAIGEFLAKIVNSETHYLNLENFKLSQFLV